MDGDDKIAMRTAQLTLLIMCAIYATPAVAGGGEHMLSIRPEYVHMTGPGGGLSVGYQWGIDDFFNLWVDAGWSGAPADGASAAVSNRVMTTVGVVYHLDSFQWIPYLSTSVGLYSAFTGEEDPRLALGFELGGGLDYRPAREWSLGLFGMFHAIAVGDIPHHGSAGLRVNLYFR